METLAALMLGDIVGEPGLRALAALLPGLREASAADIVVANGENAAAGFGITEGTVEAMFAAGVDVITTGNHVWHKRDVWPLLDAEERLLRPLNYPPGVSGHGAVRLERGGAHWIVVNAQGREGMSAIDCPFRALDAYLDAAEGGIVLVDFHAEASEEKEALAFHLDGRVGCVAGTHTHVQTADERLLPGGTAYITDLGMSGAVDSVIGMRSDVCIRRSLSQMPLKMEVAEGRAGLSGILVKFGRRDLKPLSIERLQSLEGAPGS